MAKLILKFNAAVLKEYEIQKSVMTIGRTPDNDIVIDNPAVSGHHCKIIAAGDGFYVEDLVSTNGTYLNNKRMVKARLKQDDVIGLATKHALVFVDEKPEAPAPESEDKRKFLIDPTVALPPEKQKEMAQAAQASAGLGKGPADRVGVLQILKGMVDKPNYELSGLSTYIGKSDRVQVQIKGKGFFSWAPAVAASIYRKPEGYFLVAVKENYPIVNGVEVIGQVLLKDGDIIECGATTMQFVAKKPK
jgi:pSer/pThr/pTyr-binding forkhead associated (FHA) protein